MGTITLTKMRPNEHHLWVCLNILGIVYTVYRHFPVNTVKESQKIRSQFPEMKNGHCKNLFLRDKQKQYYLFVTLEDKQISFNTLQNSLDTRRLSLGRPKEMYDFLGVKPGAVTPFAIMSPSAEGIIVVLDREILDKKYLNFHPLHNRATTTISSKDLILFIESFGYLPKIVTI